MLVIVPKWNVTVYFDSFDREATNFAISDHHIGNVLRTVASMDFGQDVKCIEVGRCVEPQPQVGAFRGDREIANG